VGDVRRETVIENQDSGTTAGTTQVGVVETVEAVGLAEFRELLVYWEVTQGMIGTSPTLRLLLQRALVPRPDPDTDAHWDDIFKFDEITTAADEQVTTLPNTLVATGITATTGWNRATGGVNDATSHPGKWGDRLRVVEIISGSGITQAAIYSLHLTGVR
jgi:hypothetical protein